MSTISLHTPDASDALCRRFAIMTTEFLDEPELARTEGAQVPLENLFRVLQMYRYEAFADERRSGILAQQSEADLVSHNLDEDEWHSKIEAALNAALETTFTGVQRDDAIGELQATLRWLAAAGNEPSDDVRLRSRTFFHRLGTELE